VYLLSLAGDTVRTIILVLIWYFCFKADSVSGRGKVEFRYFRIIWLRIYLFHK